MTQTLLISAMYWSLCKNIFPQAFESVPLARVTAETGARHFVEFLNEVGKAHRARSRFPPEEVGKTAFTGTDGLLLVIIPAIIAVVVIGGLWAIARIQKRSENLANVLMILTVVAASMLFSYLIGLAT